MAKNRSEIPAQDKWNVEALYPSIEAWRKDFIEYEGKEQSPRWPDLAAFQGRLRENPETLASMLNYYFNMDRALGKLYTYAHLRHDEDVGDDLYKQAFMKISALIHEFKQEASWIEPEILQIPDEFFQADVLKPYRIYLEKIIRLKPHMLSAREEELLAMAGFALDSSARAFSAFNNGDLKFPAVADGSGDLHELTHGKYATYLRSRDRVLRQNSFQTLHKTYFSWENTLCELIHGEVQQHLFSARARKFQTCLDAALFPHNIDPSVYTNLIETVRKNLGALHRYMELRRQLLGVEELHLWDLHVPLVAAIDLSMEYDAAEKEVIASVASLGSEYQSNLGQGLTLERWVDRYENNRKRSGAYSSGCFGGMPYILMNYQGNFHDVMTLSHEAGHSMHSYLSWKHQSYQDASYPIFVAEVASTFNEELLSRHLLASTHDPKVRAYLVNQKIEDIRNTFFRQVMFAEFELKIHNFVEQGVPLTPTLLKEEYRKLNVDYFGGSVIVDPEIDIEWARIPHFYYNFYVYQYATGISAALALVDVVDKEGAKNYLRFLSSGGSKYPLDLLSLAGVDMRQGAAIQATIRRFSELTANLESLLLPKKVNQAVASSIVGSSG